jgi:hypothetical protein
MKGTILRELTPEQYYWISEIIPVGTEVKEFMGCTYGCISPSGIAVVLPDADYFTEVPIDAVKWEV